jgi:hypothetical protein
MDGACNENGGNAYKILVVNPERKCQLRGNGSRCENNIKVDLKVIGWEGVD